MTLQEVEEGAVILVDKPINWTSFDAVNKFRSALNLKKVGHAGTLDPLASGLLILCTNKMTKQISSFQNQIKTYTGCITLGASTPSYDLETKFDKTFATNHLTKEKIEAAAKAFTGWQQQNAPAYSAVKQKGKRNFERARKGQTVPEKLRWIKVANFKLPKIDLEKTMPEVHFNITCIKGTYIRSIAHDFGKYLDCGGHLSALRRTKIGNYSVENALDIDKLIDQLKER